MELEQSNREVRQEYAARNWVSRMRPAEVMERGGNTGRNTSRRVVLTSV